jgi:NAD(P)-dependent dehydrogenase (short-subunit alcohol dehydrogenase family)
MKKNILISGSTDGIGKLVAIKFAQEGHAVFIHARNSQKLEKAIAEIKEASKKEEVSGFAADFSDLNSVRKMAQEIKHEVSHIDILINNAGVFASAAPTENGLDLRFVVNYLAPYVLTHELLPLLHKGKEARIINLSSAAQASISYEALRGQVQISVNESYAQSKLALTMWSFHLAQKEMEIKVIAVNPGSLLNTKMAREAYGQHWSPADKGVNILYELALLEEHKNSSGKYFDNDKGVYARAHADAYNKAAIELLIKETEKLID